MFNHAAVSNILNKTLDNNSILYIGTKNLFYSLLSNTDYIHYDIITNTEQPFSCIAHDDALAFSQHASSLYLQYHVNGLVFFHQEPPKALKKEDKHILSNKLNNTTKVFFSKSIQNSWGLPQDNDSYVIPYGYNIDHRPDTNGDVLVLNFSKNQIITNLYKHIKNIFNNTSMLTNIDNYHNMINYIKNYRVVISMENTYDTICCAANTAYVFTNVQSESPFSNIYIISDTNTMVSQIAEVLNNNNNNLNAINIDNNLDSFYHSMNSILSKLQNRVYKHDA